MFGLDPAQAALLLAAFVVAISCHEASHAAMATLLGDYTARSAGRLTLNPLRHLDPAGTLMLVLMVVGGVPGIGWGKPVPIDPRHMRSGRAGLALTSAAGPAANLLVAAAAAFLVRSMDILSYRPPPLLTLFLVALVLVNLSLAVFNLLPLSPLDGFGVAVGFLPYGVAKGIARLGAQGPGILLLLVFAGLLLPINPLSMLLGPPIRFLTALLLGR